MRSNRWQIGATFLGVTSALWAAAPLAGSDQRAPTISVNEIREGMKGYGLTVFKGTEPERFDVEVIGVLHNFRPAQELILVRTPHPRLNVTKNVRGMSGSPIYFDGRLAGAYAYSLASFQVEPVAGVTPIAPMLTELRRPIPAGFWPLEGGTPLPRGRAAPANRPQASLTNFEGTPGAYNVEEHAKQVAARAGMQPDPSRALVPVATPLMMSGMTDRATQMLKKIFEPIGLEPLQTGGGQGASDASLQYKDGGALGVQLVRGDVSMMGLGTTTHVEGNKVAGFGHPMMNAGDSALPTAVGRVLWIYASEQHSMKVGESVKPLGALVQDRPSAIVVDTTKQAPLFPMSINIVGVEGPPKKNWNVEIAEEKFMTASLAATVLGSVVEATVSERRDVTWQLRSKVFIRGHGDVTIDDFGVAIGGTPEMPEWFQSRVIRTIGEVLNNPWEQTRIDKVESTLTIQYTRDIWRLRGVELLDPVVDAGQPVRLRLRLTSHVGPDTMRVIETPMPRELAGRDVELEVVPGYDVAKEVAPPESLPELLANEVRQAPRPKTVVIQFRAPGQGVAYRGHVASQLPNFALDSLRPTNSDVAPEPFANQMRTFIPLDKYMEGRDKVKVKVRPVVR